MNKITPKISEIDIIIEEGLKKIVEDKINEQLGNINFSYVAERLIAERFKKEIRDIKIPKILEHLEIKKHIEHLKGKENPWGYNVIDESIRDGIKNAVTNFTTGKIEDHWGGFQTPPVEDHYVKEIVIKSEQGKNLLRSIRDIFKFF